MIRPLTQPVALLLLFTYAGYGQENWTTLKTRANTYFDLGRYREAETALQEALADLERAAGSEHSSVPVILTELANVYLVQGKPQAAEPLLRRAVVIAEKCGPRPLESGGSA